MITIIIINKPHPDLLKLKTCKALDPKSVLRKPQHVFQEMGTQIVTTALLFRRRGKPSSMALGKGVDK